MHHEYKVLIMKKLFCLLKTVFIVAVVLFATACEKDELIGKYDISGDWKMVAYIEHNTFRVIKKTEENTWSAYNNGDVTVSFTPADLTGGVISGIKITNMFFGEYTIDNKGSIKTGDIIQTMVNEPLWGRLFSSISYAERYEVRDGRLKIYCNHGKESIILEKVNK